MTDCPCERERKPFTALRWRVRSDSEDESDFHLLKQSHSLSLTRTSTMKKYFFYNPLLATSSAATKVYLATQEQPLLKPTRGMFSSGHLPSKDMRF